MHYEDVSLEENGVKIEDFDSQRNLSFWAPDFFAKFCQN